MWPQDKVKRVQAQQQAATGAAYDDVQQLSEALLSLPDHNPIKCGVCSFSTTFEEVSLPAVVTRSANRPTPPWAVENLEARDSAKKQDGPARMTSAERLDRRG